VLRLTLFAAIVMVGANHRVFTQSEPTTTSINPPAGSAAGGDHHHSRKRLSLRRDCCPR
jgi:hypothetical protein